MLPDVTIAHAARTLEGSFFEDSLVLHHAA
jgi:hypothetical protein